MKQGGGLLGIPGGSGRENWGEHMVKVHCLHVWNCHILSRRYSVLKDWANQSYKHESTHTCIVMIVFPQFLWGMGSGASHRYEMAQYFEGFVYIFPQGLLSNTMQILYSYHLYCLGNKKTNVCVCSVQRQLSSGQIHVYRTTGVVNV